MGSRRLQVLVAVNVLLLAALFVRDRGASAAPDPDVVRARLIELVDDKGQVRAQLKVEPDGEAVFRLRDAKGEIRVKLGASADGSGLLLLDGTTAPGVQVLAKTAGSSISLANRDGSRRVIAP